MRWARRRWLLSACLISLLLLTPTHCVLAVRKNSLWPPSSSSHHHTQQLIDNKDNINGFKLPFASSTRSAAASSSGFWWTYYDSEHSRPLLTSIKTSSPKGSSGDSDSSSTVVAIAVAVAGLLVIICMYLFACGGRTDDSASPYDLGRANPTAAGSSRKSSAIPIDVSRLGALPSDSCDNTVEIHNEFQGSLFSTKPHVAPVSKLKSVGAMSMKQELAERHSRLASHEVTTIAGPHEAAPSSSATSTSGSTVAPAEPSTPPGLQINGPPGAAPPTSPAPGAAPPPPPLPGTVPTPPAPPGAAPSPAPGPPPPPKATGPPAPPAPRGGAGAGPPPAPPGKGGAGPPPPALPCGPKPRGPPPLKKAGAAGVPQPDSSKVKLKPFFWDKVTANPNNQAMVWDQIKAGSFQFNEERIETLFGCNPVDKKGSDGKKDAAAKEAVQFVRILEPKKAQNLAISLKALGVSAEQVRNAVTEGSELPSDLVQTLLRWAPTSDEELRLRLYAGESTQLGHAEHFLKTIIDIPYIFQRLDVLLFMVTLPEEAAGVKQSLVTLEVACDELRNNRLFKKLLEAVLKTGNRMNDGTFRGEAQAFKLDTLLKLADVKGVDGKTTLLHFVVQEIIRSEGVRAAKDVVSEVDAEHYKQLGLAVISSLGDDLQNVRKAACLDADALTVTVASLGHRLVKANEFLDTSMKSLEEESGFHRHLVGFIERSQVEVAELLEDEKKLRELVRTTVEYFQGSTGKDDGLRLFVIVRDFLAVLDKVCREVKEAEAAANRKAVAAARSRKPSQTSMSFRDPRQQLKPAVQSRRAAAANNDDSSTSSSDSD